MNAQPQHRSNSEALTATLDLQNKKVIDVGCGEGHLVRLMTRHGAKAFGVECSAKMLEKAHEEKPVGDEVYYDGRAEELPFDDTSIDVAVFFNSLHHVPAESMEKALSEAARVLKSEGVLYICEPVAEGPHFELMQPVHDETMVRAQAYATLDKAPNYGLTAQDEFTYIHPAMHINFEAFKERMLRINPQHENAVTTHEADLLSSFKRLGTETDKGFSFDQPMRVNLFTKV
ncbi:MAG: class I SAM-dependent methyltransferase [Magnetovibrio sp.]|nr:class I SAM-dependent methyltransferase [Magnetovibrio sp.]